MSKSFKTDMQQMHQQPVGEDDPKNTAAILKVTHSLLPVPQYPPRLVPFLPSSFPPSTGKGTVGEAAGKADAKSSYDPPRSLPSLPPPPSLPLCSVANRHLLPCQRWTPSWHRPTWLGHQRPRKHRAHIQSSHHTHIIRGTSSLIPTLTVKMKSNFLL